MQVLDKPEPILQDRPPTPKEFIIDTVNLEDILKQPTERKTFNEPSGQNAGGSTDGATAGTPPPKTEEPTAVIDDTIPPPEPEPEKVDAQAPKTEPLSYHRQAEIIVGGVDAIGTFTLPLAYKTKKFTAEERKEFPRYKLNIDLRTVDPTHEIKFKDDNDKILFARYERYIKYCEKDVPFDKTEREMLIEPLAGVLEKYNFNAGPEAMLLTAAVMVMAPRIIALF